MREQPTVQQRYVFKDFPHSSHRLLLEWVGPTPCKVLEVGSATGFLGARLTAAGHTVVGLERDEEAASIAAPHYAAFYVRDAQNVPCLPEAPFDVVLAGDVIEHLPDPAAAVASLVAQLLPGGRLLVSVPNVAFFAVRLQLLLGRFDYGDRGILDRTHLHLYTCKSLVELLRGLDLHVTRLRGVPPPLPLLAQAFGRWPARAAYEAADAAARVRPSLFAFQLLVEARK